MINKKILGALALTAILGLSTTQVIAADQDVDAFIQTRAAITFTVNSDIQFGIVDYAATHSGNIDVGTDGNINLAGASGITASGGTPAAGSVTVSGDGASTVDISCETGGTLSDGGGNTLTLSATEYTTGAGGALGTGTACAGLGTTPTAVDLSVTPNPTVLMGGRINVNGNAIAASGNYDTTQGGGNPVTLRVVYQ